MTDQTTIIEDLTALNQIIESLNRTVDVRGALDTFLSRLVEVMGLETGWIFLRDPINQEEWAGSGYTLVAHLNLPPALALDTPGVWNKGCYCQSLCDGGKLNQAYNEVECSRLQEAHGDRGGLFVHASTPLRSGDEILGILNVAAPDWSAFSPRALAFLTNVGVHMGIALERARLYDLLHERRIDEQRALLSLSNQLLLRRSLDDLLQHLVAEVPRLMRADACVLVLKEPESRDLRVCAAYGWKDVSVEEPLKLSSDLQRVLNPIVNAKQVRVVADLETSDLSAPLNDWLRAQGARALAVAPLIAEGESLGGILLTSRQPWELDRNDKRLLRLLANQAAMAIEQARLHQAELTSQRLEVELDMGRRIQRSLLPPTLPENPDWEFAAFCQAARQLGGDFYDVFDLPGRSKRLGLVIADVVDKGVPAALFMVLCRTIFRETAISDRSPVDVMVRANQLIRMDSGRYEMDHERDPDAVFVSAVYAALNTHTGEIIYVNAGHNSPLLLRSGGNKIEELPARGIVIGLLDKIGLEQYQVNLEPGDSLVFFTDGITEAMNADKQMFGEERLHQTLDACRASDAKTLLEAVVDTVSDFVGEAEQSDDMTLLVVRRGDSVL